MSFANYEANWLQTQFGFANYFALIACYISYKKWLKKREVSA